MTGVNHVRILLLVAVASPLLAFLPSSQDPATTDWPKAVDTACKSMSYGKRLAAARSVAGGGAAAVPAIRAFAQKNGPDALPLALVEAIADQTTVDAPVLDLLLEWAKNGSFYWRGQAMRGLALRAPKLPERRSEFEPLFAAHHDDPAWLMRCYARFGTMLLGAATVPGAPESDPRAQVKLTTLLLAQGKVPPLQPLFKALADERTFQGDPWGQRNAREAHLALKNWLGDAHPLPDGGSFADKESAIQSLLAAARRKSGQELVAPLPAVDPATPFVGGIELLSCKHGDVFVQWTADGVVRGGIDAAVSVALPAEVWASLSKERTEQTLPASLGVVVCDALRLRWSAPDVHVKIAPGSLPAATTNWLKHLAAAIEEAGQLPLAARLRSGLEQFAAP